MAKRGKRYYFVQMSGPKGKRTSRGAKSQIDPLAGTIAGASPAIQENNSLLPSSDAELRRTGSGWASSNSSGSTGGGWGSR